MMKTSTESTHPIPRGALLIMAFLVGLGGLYPAGMKERSMAYAPLKEVYKDYFYIGAAVKLGEYNSTPFYQAYGERLLEHFNSFTAENGMKPENIYRDGTYDFTYGDRLVRYAREHGAVVRGHTLVWHNQTSSLIPGKIPKEEAKRLLKEYISTVAGHFRGEIHAWDVVNEAVGDGSQWRTSSPWYQSYGGPEYIREAFEYARMADPDAKLFYNDYNVVQPGKRERIVRMLEELDLVEAGLDGIGIQAHWNLVWPSVDEISRTIETFASMGLEVHITELDIDCYDGNPSTPQMEYTPELEERLSRRYAEIFEVFRQHKGEVTSVTFWGLTDPDSWLNGFSGGRFLKERRENYPLLFDGKGDPKKAFFSIINW
ncbi:endo-1,4-beta-xylanase [Spirochaeta thermophila]|nr:endo-1,4-beta-xylanase [Spirochaeta thermophila]